MSKKRVWLFNEADTDIQHLLGYKGTNLVKITNLGLPVPPWLIISTATCLDYLNHGEKMPAGLTDEIKNAIKIIEIETGKIFGCPENPLLFSIRPSTVFPITGMLDELYKKAVQKKNGRQATTPLYILQRIKNNFSMPGIPESVLNLGLNDEIVTNMIKLTDNPVFWYDCYTRLLACYGSVVLGLNKLKYFDIELEKIKKREGVQENSKISIPGYKFLAEQYKKVIKNNTGREFPQDSFTQLTDVIEAVFKCWNNPMAKAYREENNISHNYGSSIIVQAMVFGNKNSKSATGILATRHPATGENKFYGQYLINAQGEDTVKNNRISKSIKDLEYEMPEIYNELINISHKLEKVNKYSQEIEFTVENGKLWILKTRNGKNTANASLKIALDMQNDGIINKTDAIMIISPKTINSISNKENLQTFIKWLDEIKEIRVGANIYHPEELADAKSYGADMVGLCRTECLIPQSDNVINSWVYNLVNAKTKTERYKALKEIKKSQYNDYYTMLKEFGNKIFTFRLSDYPLEKFLPQKDELIKEIIIKKANNQSNRNDELTYNFIKKISDTNTMLGLRGSRLAIIYPELYETQIESIFEAACDLTNEGYKIIPYIMTSFISHVNELKILKELIESTAAKVMSEKNIHIEYKIGTMIELPRAALTAEELAKYADFFSFGTNDLTQMTFGYSRDNYEFIDNYTEKNIIPFNPFTKSDLEGVGQLIKMSIQNGKKSNKNLICGICGIQMRDADSVKYTIESGMDYISIDTEYIPQAKLISAQLAIEKNLSS